MSEPKRFIAIEGLRGWLAWTVVASHLAMVTNIYAFGIGPQAVRAGQIAVMVFIIVSGFVITHLCLERQEAYLPYLTRRFMRVFPLFVVTCVAGFFTTRPLIAAMAKLPWSGEPGFSFIENAANTASSIDEHLWAHVLAHLTMLHGMIPTRLLPFSMQAFNAPAWSLSLEWQFYLMAPFVVPLFREPKRWAGLALGLAAIGMFCRIWLELPGFLPAAWAYFAVGIMSRIAYPKFAGAIKHPTILAAFLCLIASVDRELDPFVIWSLTMLGLSGGSDKFTRIYQSVLQSRIALYWGARSYSVYLVHFPILSLCLYVWVDVLPTASKTATIIGLAIMVVPATAIAAQICYRLIERPGIAFGGWVIQQRSTTAQNSTPDQSRLYAPRLFES